MKNIGIDVKQPEKVCEDHNCPFHGNLKVRGQIMEGEVVSAKMVRTIVVRRDYLYYNKKYERYEKRMSKYHAHVPDCIEVNEGDKIKFMECRPISKTVSFVVIENLGGADK
ncbi:MAG: 30S ribosomal protein S17 [Thermoplasmata archaeon]